MPSRDVVIIGAGLGGLSAAIHLASRGYRVEVLEAHDRPGGKAGTVEIDGVTLDTGPSVLTMPEVFEELLSLAGRDLASTARLTQPDPAFRYNFPDDTVVDVHHDVDETIASVRAALGTEPAQELAGFLDYAQGIWDVAAPRFVYGAAPSFTSLVAGGLRTVREVTKIDPLSTMRNAIEKRVRDPYLCAILLRYATYNGSDPRRAPATLNCIAHVELGLGGFGVEGGIHRLVDAIEEAAVELGVRFAYGERVEKIVTEGRQVVGVESTRGRTDADAVVVNADARHLYETLLPRPRRVDAEPSMSGWTGLLRTRRRTGRAAHTVLFPKDYIREFEDVFDNLRPPEDPTVYVSAPAANHGQDCWPGEEALFVMVNAPALHEESNDYLAVRDVAKARIVAAGLATETDEFVWTRTPRGLAARFFGSLGSLYGAASNGPGAAFSRPANRDPRFGGLYLASGSAHPGGGMPLAVLSGRAAARALEEDLPCLADSRSSG